MTLFLNMPKAKEMMLDNSADFLSGNWEPYSISKDWILSDGEGLKTVFIKFKDPTNTRIDGL